MDILHKERMEAALEKKGGNKNKITMVVEEGIFNHHQKKKVIPVCFLHHEPYSMTPQKLAMPACHLHHEPY